MRGSYACQSNLTIATGFRVSKPFTLKPLFSPEKITHLVQKYGFIRQTEEEISTKLHSIFEEYIVLALSEMSGSIEERNAAYNEAIWYFSKAQKLLQGQPHPAGKMAAKLDDMSKTLTSVIEGADQNGAERAKRFVEKNLARKLKQFWQSNTATPFTPDICFDGHSAIEFLLECFGLAAQSFPEIEWFSQVDAHTASKLIRSVR